MPPKVLVELRPALEGHAGIPQEARLLFRGIGQIEGIEVQGLIQTSDRFLPPGLPFDAGSQQGLPANEQIDRLSRVVVSLQPAGVGRRVSIAFRAINRLQRLSKPVLLLLASMLGISQKLTWFDPLHFRDFVWRGLFAKSLPVSDFEQVTRAKFRIARAPYGVMHICGLATVRLGRAIYPLLDTKGIDAMLVMTPYPAKVAKETRLVVRYFDAVPLLMPHTIINKAHHQALHYQALRSNVMSGAYFACCSDATKRDLLSVFPELGERAVTIPCMVSHHYYEEDSSPARVPEVLAKRRNASAYSAKSVTDVLTDAVLQEKPVVEYLLMVSTLEPRKNHSTLVEAWEHLRAGAHPTLKLVFVGSLGWEHDAIIDPLLAWISSGDLILLSAVPADELRLLYRHARATVCPSYAEGFGYGGIEAMRCGGAVAASDIPVHREIYQNAAAYFNPYSANNAAEIIAELIEPSNSDSRKVLVAEGMRVAASYLPDRILPLWRDLLSGIPSNN